MGRTQKKPKEVTSGEEVDGMDRNGGQSKNSQAKGRQRGQGGGQLVKDDRRADSEKSCGTQRPE